MSADSAADRLGRFLDDEEANGAGGDDTPVYDVVGYDLTYGDLREVLRERDELREAVAALWRLPLHAVDHAWMVANADLTRALHGNPTLDAIAADAAARALPEMLSGLGERIKTDLRAARDMFRKPEDRQRSLTNATRIDHIIAEHEKRHFSPGYTGEKPDHHGSADTCAMPACRAANLRNAAADAIQDATANGRDPQ